MPEESTPPKPTHSGIQTSESGERTIPSSVRADGSVRKEIRIRPGYKPPEDIEKYKNRATEEWKKPRGIPGAESLKADDEKPALSGAAAKNAKRREARKRAAAAKEGQEEGQDEATASSSKDAEPTQTEPKQEQASDLEQSKEKEAKKLAKKLRQAKELQAKKEQGGALLPEQFEKVIKINELIRQLDLLGFDTNGEKKDEDKAKKADET